MVYRYIDSEETRLGFKERYQCTVCVNKIFSLLSAVVRGILGWWQALLWIRTDFHADPDPAAPHPDSAF